MVTSQMELRARKLESYMGSRKRPRTTLIVRRGSKPETKEMFTAISHSAQASDTECNLIPYGAASDQRIGAKVKILRIGGFCRSQSPDTSIRATLYCPKDPGQTSGNTFDGPVDLKNFWVLKEWCLHPGTELCNRGHFWSYRLPMGAITEFNGDGTSAAQFRKNRFILRLNTTAVDNIYGYVRVWYQDP